MIETVVPSDQLDKIKKLAQFEDVALLIEIRMPRNPGQVQGEISEMEVAIDLMNCNCRVSKTFGHSHPYDLIADFKNELIKIQVKTANTRSDVNQYYIKLQNPEKYDRRTVDLFAAYAKGEDDVFYVPYSEMGDKARASVTFTSLEEMGSEANRQRANHISEYTFQKALSRHRSTAP